MSAGSEIETKPVDGVATEPDGESDSQAVVVDESFGFHIEPELVAEFRKLKAEVEIHHDPSRNRFGLELVVRLANGEALSVAEKGRIFLISCDDGSDGVGEFSGIEMMSLSPQSLHPIELDGESLAVSPDRSANTTARRDLLLEAINNKEQVFQLTADTLKMLQEKEAILFVGDSRDGSHWEKFKALLDNDFMRYLMKHKHVYFGLAEWNPDMETIFHDGASTGVIAKEVRPGGQSFFHPT